MIKLALLTACERVIIEAETKSVSAITIFTGVKLAIPATAPPPPSNAAVPKDWSILAGWDIEDEEVGKEIVQYTDILFPDGKPFIEKGALKFLIEKSKRHHNTTRLLGFPVGQMGTYEIRVWIEADNMPITDKHSIFLIVENDPTVGQNIQQLTPSGTTK
jgi:hypothetical protein